MANPEHLALLKQGVEQWNRWRVEHPEVKPDLSYADLNHAYLSKINLSNIYLGHADLNYSYLSQADLSYSSLGYANLVHTDLVGSELVGTNLSYADLESADLSGTNLSDALLIGTDLVETNLSGAMLVGADLSSAIIGTTIFSNIELCGVKGLAELNHQWPSHVELHTIRLPQDGSALHFLRGCGVSDEWIDFYRAQMMHPIQYHSCFISYSSNDDIFARCLHADLQAQGVRCWFAPHDMKTGDKIRPIINKAIHLQDKLLLILSEHSVASDWVENEVETALARERKEKRRILFPIRLDNAILEREYTGWPALVQHEIHIGDFIRWKDHDQYQVAFKRLLRDLKQAGE